MVNIVQSHQDKPTHQLSPLAARVSLARSVPDLCVFERGRERVSCGSVTPSL